MLKSFFYFDRAMDAGKRFFENKGYNVIETYVDDELCDIVYVDFDEIHFVKLFIEEGDEFDNSSWSKSNRSRIEKFAVSWLIKNKDSINLNDSRISFDELDFIIIGDSNAFLRHHINALGDM